MNTGTLGFVMAALTAACGGREDTVTAADTAIDGSADAVTDTTSTDGPADPTTEVDGAPAPAWVTIKASGITGATGKIVLVGVTKTGVGGFLAAVCAPVTADPMSVNAVAKLPSASNPCDLGAEVAFADGTYEVRGGIYTGGSKTPERCANATVTVAGGPATVTLPAFGACP